MWKKTISMALSIAFVSLFTFNSVEAGSRQRNMWKGAGIALGAVALGTMAYHLFAHPSQPPQEGYYPPPEPRDYPPSPPPEYVPGHWEIAREWIPGTLERVWVPGYHDRWGRRAGGHYEERQTPGHYLERRVWIEGNYRHH